MMLIGAASARMKKKFSEFREKRERPRAVHILTEAYPALAK
jgi:hypothetical protein